MPTSIKVAGGILLLFVLFLFTPLGVVTLLVFPPVFLLLLLAVPVLLIALVKMLADVMRQRTLPQWRIVGLSLPVVIVSVLVTDHVRIGRFSRLAEENASKRTLYQINEQALVFERLYSTTDLSDPALYTLRSAGEDAEVYEIVNGQSFALRTVALSPQDCMRRAEETRIGLGATRQIGGWNGGSCVAAFPQKPDKLIVKVQIDRKTGIIPQHRLNRIRVIAPGWPPIEVYDGDYFGAFGCVRTGPASGRCGRNALILSTLGIEDVTWGGTSQTLRGAR